MVNKIKQFIRYVRSIWEGKDNKPSLRSLAAIYLLYNFVENLNYGIRHCLDHIAEIAMLLGIEAGLIAALLGLKMYENLMTKNNNLEEH